MTPTIAHPLSPLRSDSLLDRMAVHEPWAFDRARGFESHDTVGAEDIAERASNESTCVDRPRCDPRSLAVGFLGLALEPDAGAPAMIADYRRAGVVVWPSTWPKPWWADEHDAALLYPNDGDERAQAYLVAYLVGKELIRLERPELEELRLAAVHRGRRLDLLDSLASRIGRALMLPRVSFLRDVDSCGGDLARLAELWPLAHRDVIAWRMRELGRGQRAGGVDG